MYVEKVATISNQHTRAGLGDRSQAAVPHRRRLGGENRLTAA